MSFIPSPVQSVLELFAGRLASVRFADIDGAGLAQLAAEVEAAAAEVEQQESKLSELRHALAQRQEALLGLAQQALAYARVYAENDDELLDELNRISLPRPAKPRKPAAKGAREGARVEARPEADAGRADASEAAREEEGASPLDERLDEPVGGPPTSAGEAPGSGARAARKGRGSGARAAAE